MKKLKTLTIGDNVYAVPDKVTLDGKIMKFWKTLDPPETEDTLLYSIDLSVLGSVGTIDDTQIQTAVNNYLDANPVQSGATAEEAEQIRKNTDDISKLSEDIANLSGSAPIPVSVVSDMIDTTKIYLYTGTEDGYIAGNWYYYDGIAWVSGGKYGETNVTEATSIEPENDDIPKVFFDEAIPQTKDDVVTKFRYISKTKDFSGYAKFKAQGNSSMSYPKKNMTVNMYEDEKCEKKLKVDFKGWGKQQKHCYKANWIDITHARNIVSARIWADVVKSRAEYLKLPELLRTSPNQGAVDGFPVKVYSQGVYQGRYTINIPKDIWMTNMDDSLDTHCILCGEDYVSGCFRALANINGGDWTDEVHYTVPDSIKTRWNEVISFVMNSTDEEFKGTLENYFYVDSLIDYFVFGMVSCGLDGFGKNQLYLTYDGVKWIANVYDMDSTWGLYFTGGIIASDYPRESYEDMKREGNLLYIRLSLLFADRVRERYYELKKGALSVANIINHFERFIDITPLDLVEEDYATTTGGGSFTQIPSKTKNNIQQIRQYVLDRYVYCDTYFESLREPIHATGITLNKTSLTFTDATSQTIIATVEPSDSTDAVFWKSSDETIATVEGGIVTPIKKGSATITATAGSVSVTCNVTVEIEEIVYYTITRNLTNCTSSSSITSIREKTAYEETLIAGTNYTFDKGTVSITMGGSDITSTAYMNGTITIESVTGDIVITAIAGEESGIELPEGYVYSLKNREFDGVDDYVDTGIQLFDEVKDFSIYLDFTPNQSVTSNSNKFVFHCTYEGSINKGVYPGISLGSILSSDDSTNLKLGVGSKALFFPIPKGSTSRYKLVVRFNSSTRVISYRLSENGNEVANSTYKATNANIVVFEQNLLIGAYQSTSGSIGRYTEFNLHQFGVWFKQLTDEQIEAMM